MSFARDAVVLSNLAAIPVIYTSWQKGIHSVCIAMNIAMICSFVYHLVVSEQVATIWGFTKVHGLDDGVLTTWMLEGGLLSLRKWDAELLILDQMGAFLAMLSCLPYIARPRWGVVLFGLGCLGMSELTKGVTHAVFHTIWHTTAFMYAYNIINRA